jgi:membrane associated rhomboid family serine protease
VPVLATHAPCPAPPQLPFMRNLYLYHARPHWWQFITHSFCHGSFDHLSMNLFNLCVFGKLVSWLWAGW